MIYATRRFKILTQGGLRRSDGIGSKALHTASAPLDRAIFNVDQAEAYCLNEVEGIVVPRVASRRAENRCREEDLLYHFDRSFTPCDA